MPTIADIREKFPMYEDVPDGELVRGLHQKYYADMPYSNFLKNIDFRNPNEDMSHATPKEKALAQDVMARPWGSGIPKLAYNAGGNVTDFAANHGASPETAAALGYGTNVLAQAAPALASSFAFQGGKIPSLLDFPASVPGSPRWMMQSALKPAMADRASGAADRAIGTMLEEGINPTRGGMAKGAALADKMNEVSGTAIKGSTADADIASVIQRLDPLRSKIAMQVNPESDIAAVEKAVSEFKNSPAVSNAASIPVQLAHKLKSGTYASLGGKSYGELGSASTEAQKQLARGLREEVIAKVPEIAEPLKREAALRNVMDVASNRALMDANKNPLSLGTSIAAIAHDPLAAAGMWANASTPIKAMLARLLFSGSKANLVAPAAIAGSEAMNQEQ